MAYRDRPLAQATQPAPIELSIHQQTPYRLPKIEPALRETTPYRLPRIEPEDRIVTGSYKVWGRHGYKVYHEPRELAVTSSHKMAASPRIEEQLHSPYHVTSYPRLRQAAIEPVTEPPKLYANSGDPAFYKCLYTNVNCEKMNTPRCDSPTKSESSIHWVLSPYKDLHIDKKGTHRVQGPYSRKFTVTCMAPTNWLRMKWGQTAKSSPVVHQWRPSTTASTFLRGRTPLHSNHRVMKVMAGGQMF